jgi:hypothetical protein
MTVRRASCQVTSCARALVQQQLCKEVCCYKRDGVGMCLPERLAQLFVRSSGCGCEVCV